jgi:hypothetical protein
MEGSREYTVADSWQGVVLQLEGWARSKQLLPVKKRHSFFFFLRNVTQALGIVMQDNHERALVNTVMNLRVPQKAGISRLAEWLLAYQGLPSMELVCSFSSVCRSYLPRLKPDLERNGCYTTILWMNKSYFISGSAGGALCLRRQLLKLKTTDVGREQ